MQIQNGGQTPGAANVPAKDAAAAPNGVAGVSAIPTGDAFTHSNATINVMTFNTAGDACRNTPEDKIPLSQPFQQVIKGEAGAPIIANQETTPLLAKALLNEAKKNSNLQVVWPGGHTWLPAWATSTMGQSNLVVIPKRYKIQSVQSHVFKGRLGNFFRALGGVLFHHKKPNDLVLALQRRGYETISLKDTTTGKNFTVIATHIAWDPAMRAQQSGQLVAAIDAAKAKGPVTVLGDFNTASDATNFNHDKSVTNFWKTLAPTGIQDVAPTDKTQGNQDIDHVLQEGFNVKGDEVFNGNKLTIPGRPDAGQVSDHYAHETGLTIG
jgi:endonuclease/exonuclease/phosphatase family metal-dependent hydrolase